MIGLAALLLAATVASQPQPLTALPPAAHQAAPHYVFKLYRPPLALVAQNPVWLVGQNKLAFLGSPRAGEPSDLIIWDPRKRQMGRATGRPALRRDLAAAPDGRVAYVEPNTLPREPLTPADPPYLPGADRIIVYDFVTGTRKTIFAGASVVAGSLAWSPEGRLACLALDAHGAPTLALFESGQYPVITHLPAAYHLDRLVGWAGAHDVIVSASTAAGRPVLLRLGQAGAGILPPAEAPLISPDGEMMLDHDEQQRVVLRGAGGGVRVLSATAGICAWDAHQNGVFLILGQDLVSFDAQGHVRRRYKGVAALNPSALVPSPDGRFMALSTPTGLLVLAL